MTDALPDSDPPEDNAGVSFWDLVAESSPVALVDADTLHAAGIDGTGVTIAVVDTGLWSSEAKNGFYWRNVHRVDLTDGESAEDDNGHGTHITATMAASTRTPDGYYEGIAPGTDIVAIRAFDADGSGTYAGVIRALDWVLSNRDAHDIRVLNLSFGAEPRSHYWDDPLNQAVMRLWQAGIVVVVSAGNSGPDPMTVNVPGNVPYVITVGAMSDNFTPSEGADDPLASFSSAGPTYEGFVKPDLVAPGGHVVARMSDDSYIARSHLGSIDPYQWHFAMSGTSPAAAVVSGVAALMLQADPSLTPDNVKCRLLASSRPALDDEGHPAYSVFQQGAGMVNAIDAVYSTATNCANEYMDIALDLAGERHYGGPANQDADGSYYVMDMSAEDGRLDGDGYIWGRGYVWGQGYIWSQGYVWSQAYIWSRGYIWSQGDVWGQGYIWSQGYVWGQGYVWSQSLPWDDSSDSSPGAAMPMSVNRWVEHE